MLRHRLPRAAATRQQRVLMARNAAAYYLQRCIQNQAHAEQDRSARTQTHAALLGSLATTIALFYGGPAVEVHKRRRDWMGMALAIPGAIDAMLSPIEARDMVTELGGALSEL